MAVTLKKSLWMLIAGLFWAWCAHMALRKQLWTNDSFAYVVMIGGLIVALVGGALAFYSSAMKVMTQVFGKPVQVRVLRKEIAEEERISDAGSYTVFTYHVAIEYSEGSSEYEVSKMLFNELAEGDDYTVKGVVWADGEFTFVGKWKPVVKP